MYFGVVVKNNIGNLFSCLLEASQLQLISQTKSKSLLNLCSFKVTFIAVDVPLPVTSFKGS